MDITNYMRAGYSSIFINTSEIKRAVDSIKVEEPFKKIDWNMVSGLGNSDAREITDQMEIFEKAKQFPQTAIICENFDWFIENPMIIQTFLNNYNEYKFQQICLVFIGVDYTKIPKQLKEFIPIIDFNLPTKEEITELITDLAKGAEEECRNKKEYDFYFSNDIIEMCMGLSYEEIENILALSLIEKKKFDLNVVLERKKHIIKATGFMEFIQPEPIENLGGLENFKQYIYKRKEAFEEKDWKPKLKSVLLLGLPGTGKSLSVKCVASIFNWPAIVLDIGATKGGLVGETEKNIRHATKVIDSMNRVIVCIDEIEKSLGGTKNNLDSGVSQGMVGHLLTWFQERKSEGILMATANNIDALPPEMLRAGRWSAIFFVDAPNEKEIKFIIDIMNKKYKAKIPTDSEFCKQLKEEGWTGAEIEQLAIDSHFDTLENAMNNIPLLTDFRKEEIDNLRKKAKLYRKANDEVTGGILRSKKLIKKTSRIGFT